MVKSKRKTKKVRSRVLLTLLVLIVSILVLIPVLNNLKLGLDLQGGFEILYKVDSIDGKSKVTSDMVNATYKTMLKRIDVLGVLEPTISIEGNNIRVGLAGIDNADDARDLLSQTATLTFRDTNDNLLMTSDILKTGGAKVSQDQNGRPAVSLGVADKDEFYKATKKVSEMSDNRIVIWLDFEEGSDSFASEGNKCGVLDQSRCLSVASVTQGFSSDVIIQGNFEQKDVEQLVDLINSGSMPTKLTEVSSQSVEASFGANSLTKTVTAGIIGVLVIIVLLTCLYKVSGLLASVGIIVYTAVTFFIFWLINGTLTLPGIAAMIIGIGMAVDSNVLNFARIKEELYNGKSLQTAFKNGNKASFGTIMDANVTTFIVAIMLFIFGQSSVKGFATMLIISIFSTLAIMLFFTRMLMRKYVETKYFDDKTKLFIGVDKKDIPDVNGKVIKKSFNNFDFVSKRKIFIILTIIISIVGMTFIGLKGLKLGVDFKGGTAITLNTSQKISESQINKDVKNLGYDMYSFEKQTNNAYSIKISETLSPKKSISLKNYFADKYNANADIGVISETVKNELIKNACLSIVLAVISIIIYMSIRYKFSYAISSIIALAVNVIVTISFFSIFRLEVSNIFIAAILSIIGYSINDIIITFDRIKEEYNKHKNIKDPSCLNDIVNDSLRNILSRSIVTTITTLIAVISLLIFGSHEIITFYIALIVGIVTGVLTSLFVASQIWLEIEKKTFKKGKNKKKKVEEKEVEELLIKGINS